MEPETTSALNTEATETLAKVNDLLDWIGTSAADAQGFAIEQAPMVAKEIVAWGVWTNFLLAALLFCLSAALLVFIRPWSLAARRRKFENEDDAITFSVVNTAAGIAFLSASLAFISHGIPAALEGTKAVVAPRLYLLEWCRDAVN